MDSNSHQPIRVLFLAANPSDTSSLSLGREVRTITESIQRSQSKQAIQLVSQWAVRPQDLQRALLEHQPQIVHFSGHGTDDGLLFLDEDDAATLIPPQVLAATFSTFKDTVRLVVLGACYSGPQAQAIAEHIDCTIGVQRELGEDTAATFSEAFYMGLGHGRSIAEAFRIGVNEIKLRKPAGSHEPMLITRPGLDTARWRHPRGATRPSRSARRERSRTALLLDRSRHWQDVRTLCNRADHPIAFVVYGRSSQNVGLFTARIKHSLNEEEPGENWRYHRVETLSFKVDDYTVAESADDWEKELRRIFNLGWRGDLARALARAASDGLMLILDQPGPLHDLTPYQTEALTEFLADRLPALITEAGSEIPLRLLIPIHSSARTRRRDPFIRDVTRALDRAAKQTGTLTSKIIGPLEFPPWGEVEDFLENELEREMGITHSATIERFIEICDELYRQHFDRLPEEERSYAELVDLLDDQLRQLKPDTG